MRKLYVELLPDASVDSFPSTVTQEYLNNFKQSKRLTLITNTDGYAELKDNPDLAYLIAKGHTDFDIWEWLFMPDHYKIILEKPMEN
ncbi:hypothetical protein VOWphi5012_045 [Vibrio phage phi50-12]|uniref:Uncharacterized protein n=1 Tax=Vibrio phage phi50-12 TaxID=2654972 RepID=A0A5P8PRD3_9CAUD|nr:hypothetical protein KNU82_gp045 [Vibrio phage phi50-12]QFR59829.1 hypothetical protein VOWphi5012_045 [Vibrio phage phi50-12]